jgi:hypothetical protein
LPNYEPGNCRWASALDQTRNTRASVVTLDIAREIIERFMRGETKASIGRHLGIASAYVGAIVRGKAWAEIDRPYLNKV